jgi:hypothetical protein
MAGGDVQRGWARVWAAGVLIAAAGIALAISWPGHLSYDSVIQLHDGRASFYHSWHPPVMAWLLGLGDAILPGSGLFVIFNMALFFGALFSLLWVRPHVSWIAVVVAAAIMFLPQIVLYQAIVWKDVLFANAAVAGFVCLALTEVQWSSPVGRYALLIASFLLFALASLTRQNGIIVLGIGVCALGVISWRKGSVASALLMCGLALIVSLCVLVFSNSALDARSDHDQGPIAQLKLLRLYDIVGMVANDGSIKLDRLDADAHDLGWLIRSDGVRLYSPQRNDTLVGSAALQSALADTGPETMKAQWFGLIRQHPLLYLKVRAIEFGWVFLTPDIALCRPVFVGIEGPAGEMADLGLAPRRSATDLALQRYVTAFMGTPFLSHGFYGVLALVLMVFLLRRRSPGDLAITAMLGAALVFSASFFVISIACDYRYLYFLDLAVLSALFYAALDANYRFQVVAMWSGSF